MTSADQTHAEPIGHDPILVKRAKVSRLATAGVRIGGLTYLVAVVLFFFAIATEFTGRVTATITVCLLIGSAVLAPAMVLKYTVKAADRADRDGTW